MKTGIKPLLFALILIMGLPVAAQALTIGSGAGYRRPVDELAAAFRKQTGLEVNLVYGNMGRVISQIKSGGVVDVFLGERRFLKASGLAFGRSAELGGAGWCWPGPRAGAWPRPRT